MSGFVSLVGAGPGDPRLITLRGVECLRAADVVAYDRLVASELLEHCRPDADLRYVGKDPADASLTQLAISELLVTEARAGRVVVRLKGGDPYVFGRGGEEALTLREAGIPFEVVSGVSSAFAVPAAAGIPLSMRGIASNFAVVSAHCSGLDERPWAAFAQIDTLVFLMGATHVAEICARLIDAGRDPQTPAAAVERGTTPRQREVWAPLGELPAAFAESGLSAPSTIVVGEVTAVARVLRGELAAEAVA